MFKAYSKRRTPPHNHNHQKATTPADYTNVRVDNCDTGRAERWQVIIIWLLFLISIILWSSYHMLWSSCNHHIILWSYNQVSENGEIKHASSGHCLDEDQNNEHQVELYSCSGFDLQHHFHHHGRSHCEDHLFDCHHHDNVIRSRLAEMGRGWEDDKE